MNMHVINFREIVKYASVKWQMEVSFVISELRNTDAMKSFHFVVNQV